VITHPSADEILQAVAQWIDDLRPQLDERNAFLARVALHGLATVQRELARGPEADAAVAQRLAALLGREGSVDALTRVLCERLRSGEYDASTPGLLPALRANTLDQLQIDQPGYRTA